MGCHHERARSNAALVLTTLGRAPQQIEWKKKYHKYKPLRHPGKCNICGEKKINKAYHVLCDGCAQKHKKCGKCMEDKHVLKRYQKTEAELHHDQQVFENKLSQMPERDRRKIMRRLEAGEDGLEEEVLAMDTKPSAEEEEEEEVPQTEEDAMAAAMDAMDEEEDFDDLDDEDADEV